MVAEPARDQVPEWDGQANTLERFEEDVLIFTHAVPKERKGTIGPKLLRQFPKGSPQVRCAATGGRHYSVAETHSTPSREGFAARRFRTLQTFPSSFRAFVQQSMQHYIAEESNLHERALQVVKSVSTPGKDETETKEIIADVLRGFLLLENAALTGSELVFVFGVAGKSYAYNHIAKALRALSHLAGVVHWTGEEDDWQETDHDHEDSLEPWTSELYGTDGYDDESHLEETDWTEDLYETDDYDPNDSTFSDHYPALQDQTVETQEGDTSKLKTVQTQLLT